MYTKTRMCLFQRGNLWQMTIKMTDFLQSHLLITQGMGISTEDCRKNSNMAKGNLPLIKDRLKSPHKGMGYVSLPSGLPSSPWYPAMINQSKQSKDLNSK